MSYFAGEIIVEDLTIGFQEFFIVINQGGVMLK